MKVLKNSELADWQNPVESTDFKERDKYQDENSIAVKFEQRFHLMPPMPTEVRALQESPRFTARKKRIVDLTFLDWELIRMTYLKNIAINEAKRIEERAAQIRKIEDDDKKAWFTYQMDEQKFRIYMTWLERFRTEKSLRKHRIEAHMEFIEEIRQHAKEGREQVRLDNFLFRRQRGLDTLKPKVPIKYAIESSRAELEARHEIKDHRDTVHELLTERIKMAQQQVAIILLKAEINRQTIDENEEGFTGHGDYVVKKIKKTK